MTNDGVLALVNLSFSINGQISAIILYLFVELTIYLNVGDFITERERESAAISSFGLIRSYKREASIKELMTMK